MGKMEEIMPILKIYISEMPLLKVGIPSTEGGRHFHYKNCLASYWQDGATDLSKSHYCCFCQ